MKRSSASLAETSLVILQRSEVNRMDLRSAGAPLTAGLLGAFFRRLAIRSTKLRPKPAGIIQQWNCSIMEDVGL
jgi:hypothetical protein